MTLSSWHAEVVGLHDFFQGWLDGTLPETDAVYARLAATTAPEMLIVTPGGERVLGAQLAAELRGAHGSRPGWRMWIEAAELRLEAGGLLVVTYEEWHRSAAGEVRGRLSTAVLREQAGTPHGLAWLHVHETWLPAGSQPRALP